MKTIAKKLQKIPVVDLVLNITKGPCSVVIFFNTMHIMFCGCNVKTMKVPYLRQLPSGFKEPATKKCNVNGRVKG